MEPKTIEYDGKSCELTEDDLRYGKLAGDDAAKGRNPASWVEDEAAWEKAKEAADKNKGADDYYALVTHIYKQMGGGIKSQKASPSPKEMRARRRMAADTSLQG